MTAINYYFDQHDLLHPYTHCLPANPDTLPPDNASRSTPEFKAGFWPCWNGASWYLAEDHRAAKAYDPETGAEVKICAFGPWPENLTGLPKPGPAYRWDGDGWVYDLSLDRPGPDYDWDEDAGQWIRKRFTKKDFLLLCGIRQVAALNAAISAGSAMAKTVHDLLFASEYIDVSDPATGQLVQLLTTPEAGSVLTAAQAAEILKSAPYDQSQQ